MKKIRAREGIALKHSNRIWLYNWGIHFKKSLMSFIYDHLISHKRSFYLINSYFIYNIQDIRFIIIDLIMKEINTNYEVTIIQEYHGNNQT